MIELEEDFALAMAESQNHQTLVDFCEMIYRHGLSRTLSRLSDYCQDSKEAYALQMMGDFYKENESDFCKNAPTLQ